jgi:hypothetical protein
LGWCPLKERCCRIRLTAPHRLVKDKLMLRALVLIILAWCLTVGALEAGPQPYTGNDLKQAVAPTPCPEWYADEEWNVSLWGTYAFAGSDGHAEIGNSFNFNRQFATFNLSEFFSNDRYLETDHAWGGGVDVKYFFRKYFGVGIEGFVLDAKRNTIDIEVPAPLIFSVTKGEERRAIGSVLGTVTIRYPLHCSRLSPYVWAGVGGIFNGGERDILFVDNSKPNLSATTGHTGGQSEVVGQFGGGIEFRFTPHIGWMNDFSWTVINGPGNNFGMARSGLNFSF